MMSHLPRHLKSPVLPLSQPPHAPPCPHCQPMPEQGTQPPEQQPFYRRMNTFTMLVLLLPLLAVCLKFILTPGVEAQTLWQEIISPLLQIGIPYYIGLSLKVK